MIAYRLNCKEGDLIDGKYQVINRIGSGSYGDVFKVKDISGNIYALKLLRLWEVSSDLHTSLVRKFEREYAAARIPSDYLVHSKSFGIVHGNPYLVMEFCEKGDLSKLIGKNNPNIVKYAHDILEGLHVLHSAGKVHRDLKPENVLIIKNGKAAITDFGVIGEMDKHRRLSESEVGFWKKRMAQIHGTPPYMSPEMRDAIAGGVTYLPTVDIWSFGVMMFELLSGGKFPFGPLETFDDLPKYFARAKKHDWDSYFLKGIAHEGDWIYILGKCLHPDYKMRYQSAYDVLKDLQSLLLIGNIQMPQYADRKSRKPNIESLEITQGDNMGEIYILSELLNGKGRMLKIGRETDNDIVLPEQISTYVSRHHFTLEKSLNGNFWLIKDGQWNIFEKRWVTSTNGTYINAVPVSKEGLKVFTGDIITVGEYKIKVN